LLTMAIRYVPALADATVERAWAGLRPATRDGRPYLGPVPGLENLFVAAGHFRSGLQLSIITGILMKEMLLGEPTRLNLEPSTLQLILHLEDLRRRRPHPEDESPQAAAARGLACVRTVQLSKTDPSWQTHVRQVRQILRTTGRASSLVECINSVARMQQSRHRRMTPGLLALKRLYWDCRVFRTGRRRRQTPYGLLGVRPLGLHPKCEQARHDNPDCPHVPLLFKVPRIAGY